MYGFADNIEPIDQVEDERIKVPGFHAFAHRTAAIYSFLRMTIGQAPMRG
jgi:hypothetical protein